MSDKRQAIWCVAFFRNCLANPAKTFRRQAPLRPMFLSAVPLFLLVLCGGSMMVLAALQVPRNLHTMGHTENSSVHNRPSGHTNPEVDSVPCPTLVGIGITVGGSRLLETTGYDSAVASRVDRYPSSANSITRPLRSIKRYLDPTAFLVLCSTKVRWWNSNS